MLFHVLCVLSSQRKTASFHFTFLSKISSTSKETDSVSIGIDKNLNPRWHFIHRATGTATAKPDLLAWATTHQNAAENVTNRIISATSMSAFTVFVCNKQY